MALALIAGGCQSYRAEPLELGAHRESFLARTPESPEVAAFARALAPDDPPDRAVFDLADGITRDEAEAAALVFNADLRIARLRAGVTEASAANAGLWEDPVIGVDLTRIIESNPYPWKVFTAVGFTIPISGRLEVEKQRAGAAHIAELARVAAAEWEMRIDLREAWTRWQALDAEVSVTSEFLARMDDVLALVDLMERAGEISRTEARLFRIEQATSATELAVLSAARTEAELEIKHLIGLAPSAPVRLVASGFREHAIPVSAGAIEATNPALLVSAAEYEIAERTLELEIRQQYPDLNIGPGYGREDGQNQVLLGLSVPVPVINGNRRGIAEATAARDVARAGAEAALETLLADIAASEVRLAAASARRITLEREIVPLVDAQYADAREIARLGEVNTLVILESLQRQREAKDSLIESHRDEALAAIRLQELIGPESPAAEEDHP